LHAKRRQNTIFLIEIFFIDKQVIKQDIAALDSFYRRHGRQFELDQIEISEINFVTFYNSY
jgi:hypothetical protein